MAAVAKLDDAVKIIPGSDLTDPIHDVHGKMVRTLSGLAHAVAAVERHVNHDKAAQGKSLMRVIKNYPNVRTDNYEASAADAHNIVADLKSDRYEDTVEQLGLTEWVTTLESIVSTFRELVHDRHVEHGSLPKGAAREARLLCRTYERALRFRVLSHVYPGAAANRKLDEFIDTVRDIRQRYVIVADSPGHHGGGGGGSSGGPGGGVIHPIGWDEGEE